MDYNLEQLLELFKGKPEELKTNTKLRQVLRRLSFRDNALILFVASLWLPNISAFAKVRYLLAHILSLNEEEFSKTDRIKTYQNFKARLKVITQHIPSFPMREDFMPSLDWGDVSYRLDDGNYKIFYGSNFEHLYDAYQTCFLLAEGLLEQTPPPEKARLEAAIKLQDRIIRSITTQPHVERSALSPGHFELPTEAFFAEALRLFDLLSDKMPDALVNLKDTQEPSNTFDLSLSIGELVPRGVVLSNSAKTYPALVRDIGPAIILDMRDQFMTALLSTNSNPLARLNITLMRRLKETTPRPAHFFPLVRAHDPSNPGKLLDPVFCGCALHDQIYLFNVLPPQSITSSNWDSDLRKHSEELQESLRLIKNQSKLSSLDGSRIADLSTPSGIQVKIISILPSYPYEVSGRHWNIYLGNLVVDFYGFISMSDDLIKHKDWGDFIRFKESHSVSLGSTLLDTWAAFRYSDNELIEGAENPTEIVLAPTMGPDYRYEQLSSFWNRIPKAPPMKSSTIHSWEILDQSTNDLTVLRFKPLDKIFYHTGLNQTDIYITSQDETGLELVGFLTETIIEAIRASKDELESLPCFNHKYDILIQLSEETTGKAFQAIATQTHPQKVLIELSFSPEVEKLFTEKRDNRISEVYLFCLIFKAFSKIIKNPELESALSKIEQDAPYKRPLTFLSSIQRAFHGVARPSQIKPEPTHIKRAQKALAYKGKELNVLPGEFRGEQAKTSINLLKEGLVSIIDNEVKKYAPLGSLILAIEAFERSAILSDNNHKSNRLSLESRIGPLSPNERALQTSESITNLASLKYLLEKTVQYSNVSESKDITPEDFQHLLALCSLHLTLSQSSDFIHYGLSPGRLIIKENFITEVELGANQEERLMSARQFGVRLNTHEYGEVDQSDLTNEQENERYIDELNLAFEEDLGFSLIQMLEVMGALATWDPDSPPRLHHKASFEQILKGCRFLKLTSKDLRPILKFLTLSHRNVLQVAGSEEPAQDVPTWEIKKRPYRYMIRPIVKYKNDYLWSPAACSTSARRWLSSLLDGTPPYNMQNKAISKCIARRKALFENRLEDKVYCIAKKHTNHLEKNLYPHKKFPFQKGNIGDIDILCYLPEQNTLLAIDAKYWAPNFCIKDASSLVNLTLKESLKKIKKRHSFVSENSSQIMEHLKWDQVGGTSPEVRSIIITLEYHEELYSHPEIEIFPISYLDKLLGDSDE